VMVDRPNQEAIAFAENLLGTHAVES